MLYLLNIFCNTYINITKCLYIENTVLVVMKTRAEQEAEDVEEYYRQKWAEDEENAHVNHSWEDLEEDEEM